jgi:hypothetical protein
MKTTQSRRLVRSAAWLTAAAFLGAGGAVTADQIVYFVNGKAMMVRSVEKGEKFTVLEVEGGGRIGVPTEQIDRIEEYQVSPPQAPAQAALVPAPPAGFAPAPQQAPGQPAPTAVVSRSPVASPGGPAAPPLPPGPGFGGRAQSNPQGLAGLTPLALGGEGQAPLASHPAAPQGGQASQATRPAAPQGQAGAGPGLGGNRGGAGIYNRGARGNRLGQNRFGRPGGRGRPGGMGPQVTAADPETGGNAGTTPDPGTQNPPEPEPGPPDDPNSATGGEEEGSPETGTDGPPEE